MILLLDNYDSFTYNLYDYLLQLQVDCQVFRNDELSVSNISEMAPQGIVLSPGPQTPDKAGMMMNLIKQYHSTIPMLGICLGFQGIGTYFGATLVKSAKPMHGKTSFLQHDGSLLFHGLPSTIPVMRYHSLVLKDMDQTPLKITARTSDGTPMAFQHPNFPVFGVQFHPESILTPHGLAILKNWLRVIKQEVDPLLNEAGNHF